MLPEDIFGLRTSSFGTTLDSLGRQQGIIRKEKQMGQTEACRPVHLPPGGPDPRVVYLLTNRGNHWSYELAQPEHANHIREGTKCEEYPVILRRYVRLNGANECVDVIGTRHQPRPQARGPWLPALRISSTWWFDERCNPTT